MAPLAPNGVGVNSFNGYAAVVSPMRSKLQRSLSHQNVPPFIDRGDGGRDGRDGLTAPTIEDGTMEGVMSFDVDHIISEIGKEMSFPALPPDDKFMRDQRAKNADLSMFIDAMEFVPTAATPGGPRSDTPATNGAVPATKETPDAVVEHEGGCAVDEEEEKDLNDLKATDSTERSGGDGGDGRGDDKDFYGLFSDRIVGPFEDRNDSQLEVQHNEHTDSRKASEEPTFKSASPTTDGSYEMKEGSLGDERAAKGDVAMAEAMELEVGGGGGGGVVDGNMEADMCPDVSFSDLSDVADISKADGGFIAKVN